MRVGGHSFTIFADRHKSRQGSVSIRTCLDGGSRLPPVAEKKNAARGLKLGEERVFSGSERDEAGTPRAF